MSADPHADVEHSVSGWAPNAIVSVYIAVMQEARRLSGEPPLGAPLSSGRADAGGTATFTVPGNVGLAAYGVRVDGTPRWILTSAQQPWQIRPRYTTGGVYFGSHEDAVAQGAR